MIIDNDPDDPPPQQTWVDLYWSILNRLAEQDLAYCRMLGLLAVLLLLPVGVQAHEPQTHQANELADARNKVGGMCCDGQDYEIPLDWKRTDFGFRIKLVGHGWLDADAQVEVANKKKDGEARAWLYSDEMGGWHVRCFMPGVEA
jgi:hypothetical protein